MTEFLRERRESNRVTGFSNAGKAMCKTLDAMGLLKGGMKFFSGFLHISVPLSYKFTSPDFL